MYKIVDKLCKYKIHDILSFYNWIIEILRLRYCMLMPSVKACFKLTYGIIKYRVATIKTVIGIVMQCSNMSKLPIRATNERTDRPYRRALHLEIRF